MARKDEKGDALLFIGLIGLGVAIGSSGGTKRSSPIIQEPTPVPPTTQPRARVSSFLFCDRGLRYDKAPGLLYLKETWRNNQERSIDKWPVFTGRKAQPYAKHEPRSAEPQPDYDAPLTVYNQPNVYLYKLLGPLEWKNVFENPLVGQEQLINPLEPYYQWIAPLQLGSISYNNKGEKKFQSVWNNDQPDAYLVIQDQFAEKYAQSKGLKYPIVPVAITIRSTQREASSIATTLNLALTQNMNAGSLLGIAFNE